MNDEEKTTTDLPEDKSGKHAYSVPAKNNGVASGVYGLAFIGAAIYYIGHAATFWAGVLGFIKALVWPAILVYNVLEYLKM